MNIVCEICSEKIAVVDDPKVLVLPMTGQMFGSPDVFHQFDPPFHPNAEWLDMMCPYCRKRPFIEMDRVLTDQGYFMVPSPPEIVETLAPPEKPEHMQPRPCPVCGKSIGSAAGLAAHMRTHEKG